jgi:hypothetical protein
MTDTNLLRSEIAVVMQHIQALDRRVVDLRKADQEALKVALETLKERLGLLNELRQVVVDQSRDFARAKEVEQKFEAIKDDVETLERVVDNMRSGSTARDASVAETRMLILGGVSLIVGIVLAAVALLTWLNTP